MQYFTYPLPIKRITHVQHVETGLLFSIYPIDLIGIFVYTFLSPVERELSLRTYANLLNYHMRYVIICLWNSDRSFGTGDGLPG